MSNADNIFWRRFGAILVALTVFGLVVAFIARDIAGDAHRAAINSPAAVADRIAPHGMVRVGDPAKVVAAAPAKATAAPAAAPGGSADGESVYNGACVACHLAGVAGAPKLGDAAAWAPRLAAGEEALLASVVKGKGAMPPKGGNAALTDEQLKAAVAYMVAKASPQGAAPAGATTAKVEAAAPGKTTAAAAPSAAPAAAPAGSADGASVYNSACVACHVAGVAGAPKLGDEAAWAPRLAAGEEALLASVVNGKGAMPPKGGNPSLTDEQLKAAVAYMVAKASPQGSAPAGAATAAPEAVKEAASDKAASAAGTAMEKASGKAAGTAMEKTSEKAAGAAAGAAMAATAPAAASGGKPGDEVYNMSCVACHATGAANAPKLSDQAAWKTRVATGVDALITSVIKGKGAMPPKGGAATLSDTDIGNAVRYMLKEAGVEGGG